MPRPLAAVALVLLLAATLILTGRRSEPLRVPPPGQAGGAVDALVAELAPIGGLDEFAVNDDNPFVPAYLRSPPERNRPRTGADDGAGSTGSVKDPTVTPPALPPGRMVDVDAPRCLGRVHHPASGGDAVIVRDAAGTEQALLPGEHIGGWRLLEIGRGNARFVSPAGVERVLPY